jgi:hypothetical protein
MSDENEAPKAEGGEKLGLGAAVDAVVAAVGVGHPPLPPAPRQLPLLAGQADEEQGEELAATPSDAPRGPGRPPGAKNKRTDEWCDYLMQRYRSPLVVLAETYSRPVELLQRELNCSRLDAFKLQLGAAKELAPYVHQKQPIAVTVDGAGVVRMVVETSPEVAAMMAASGNGDGAIVINGTATTVSETISAISAADQRMNGENEENQ